MRSGDIIRNARLTSGLTQSELAQRAGLTQTQVSRLESGHGDPPFSTFIALIQAAGRDISLRLTTTSPSTSSPTTSAALSRGSASAR